MYRNPATDRIIVALPKNTPGVWIELMDGTGSPVLIESIYAKTCISTATHLCPGGCFYKIYNQEHVLKWEGGEALDQDLYS